MGRRSGSQRVWRAVRDAYRVRPTRSERAEFDATWVPGWWGPREWHEVRAELGRAWRVARFRAEHGRGWVRLRARSEPAAPRPPAGWWWTAEDVRVLAEVAREPGDAEARYAAAVALASVAAAEARGCSRVRWAPTARALEVAAADADAAVRAAGARGLAVLAASEARAVLRAWRARGEPAAAVAAVLAQALEDAADAAATRAG